MFFSHRFLRIVAGAVLLLGSVVAAAAAKPDPAALKAEVVATETAFAKSMADRDFAAFQGFLSQEAVFFSGDTALRGKATVAEHWNPLYAKPQAPFSWAPETVEVLDSGTLALSSGPVHDPSGKLVGTFSSIWRREAKGTWKIVFDKGCDVCAACPAQ